VTPHPKDAAFSFVRRGVLGYLGIIMRADIEKVLVSVAGERATGTVAVAAKAEFGHYTSNVAMRLAKEAQKNPLELAKELAGRLAAEAPEGLFEKVEAAAPGFVNFWLSADAMRQGFAVVRTAKATFGRSKEGVGKKVIVEYSSPNIAKPMHIGHLRNTVLGDALANLHDALGYEVVRWNYLGDWGTQFGKIIAAYKRWGKKEDVAMRPVEAMLELYVRFHKEAAEDPALEAAGSEEFKKLEDGDPENRELLAWLGEESKKELNRLYGELGVVFDVEIGESFFEDQMKPVTEELVQKGLAKESEGALIVPLDAEGLPPALVRKSDGASLYLTRDIANLKYRLAEHDPAKILYVVANEQSLHFTQLFAVAKLLGLAEGTELAHVKYGLVLAEAGKKFSTREGNAVTFEEALVKAKELARKIVEEKNPDLAPEEKTEVAHAVAVGALKHANLRENRNSDIVFDWDRMLDFSGESGPYLQYTYARLRSILRKAEERVPGDPALLGSESELALVRKIFEYPDVLRTAGLSLAPNLLVTWTYELATVANRFYEATPILKDEDAARRNSRLDLVETAAAVLKDALSLVGIAAPERI
jgi:arginyl-tRNA synthetase